MLLAISQPPVRFGPGEWVFFLLANAIIIGICAPKLLGDVRRWVRDGGVRGKRYEAGSGGEG